MGWNIEKIKEARKVHIEQKYGNLSKEELLEALLELESSVYPVAYVLKGLLGKTPIGTWVYSKLFPFQTENDDVLISNDKETREVKFHSLDESELHQIEYSLIESIDIKDGTRLHDDFMILDVTQEYFGGATNCGTITIGDIRRLDRILFSKLKEDV